MSGTYTTKASKGGGMPRHYVSDGDGEIIGVIFDEIGPEGRILARGRFAAWQSRTGRVAFFDTVEAAAEYVADGRTLAAEEPACVSVRGGKVHTASPASVASAVFPLCRTGAQDSTGTRYRSIDAEITCRTCVEQARRRAVAAAAS